MRLCTLLHDGSVHGLGPHATALTSQGPMYSSLIAQAAGQAASEISFEMDGQHQHAPSASCRKIDCNSNPMHDALTQQWIPHDGYPTAHGQRVDHSMH